MKNDISISEVEKSTIRKLSFRILPFLILCYFIAYIDRVNIGFAALTMNQEMKANQYKETTSKFNQNC